MARSEFLQNLRLARNLLAHRVSTDQSDVDDAHIASMLSRADLWLTPAAVRGFDPADFAELSAATRTELDRRVREFRDIAAQVPNNGPATAEQAMTARRDFDEILRVMEAYLPTTEEVHRLRRGMKEVDFPEVVWTWEFEFGRDSSGDPAVWIWIVVDDAAADDSAFATATTRLSRKIRESLQKAGLDRWPYVRFRTASEQRTLQTVTP